MLPVLSVLCWRGCGPTWAELCQGTPGLLFSHTPLLKATFPSTTRGDLQLKFIICFTVDMSEVITVKVFQCSGVERPACAAGAGPQQRVQREAHTGKHSFGKAPPKSRSAWITQIPAIRLGIQRTWKNEMIFCAFCDVWCCVCTEVSLALFSLSDVPQDFFPNF